MPHPCREKAPFTLCVEVLDEAEAAAAAELRAAAQAAAVQAAAAQAAAAVALDALGKPAEGAGSCADSAKSLLVEVPPPSAVTLPVADEGAAAAAAEAAANGIRFVANHHRTLSMETVSTSSSAADAAALAAVQGSSATTGDAVAAARVLQPPAAGAGGGSRASVGSGAAHGQAEGALGGEPSFAGLLQAGGSPAGGPSPSAPPTGNPSMPSSPGLPRPRRLTDELDAVSDVPSCSESGSGPLGSPLTGSGDSLGLSGLSSPCSVNFELASPRQRGQAPADPADRQLQQRLAALNLPGKTGGKQAGGGTWIGGNKSPPPTGHRQSQAAQQQAQQPSSGGSPSLSSSGGGGGARQLADVASSLDRALAGLRGEAPLVSVRLQVINDRPLSSARSSGSGAADQQHGTPRSVDSVGSGSSAAAAAAERRRASLDAARRAPHQCDTNSWACKLGLCKLCNTKLATMGDDEDAPYVRVHFSVHGGVGEAGPGRRVWAKIYVYFLHARRGCA